MQCIFTPAEALCAVHRCAILLSRKMPQNLSAQISHNGKREAGRGLWEKGCREGTVGKGMQVGACEKVMQGADCGERHSGS